MYNAVYSVEPLVASNMRLNAEGSADGSGVDILTLPTSLDPEDNQKWQAKYVGGGYWKFCPQNSSTYVLNDKGGTAAGTQVQVGTDDGSDATL
jgi:hypothetical protein